MAMEAAWPICIGRSDPKLQAPWSRSWICGSSGALSAGSHVSCARGFRSRLVCKSFCGSGMGAYGAEREVSPVVRGEDARMQDKRLELLEEWFEAARPLLLGCSFACIAWHARHPSAYAASLGGDAKALAARILPSIGPLFNVLREQGILLSLLLGFSAFFSMAETSITTLWPWKVKELAGKDGDGGVFQMLRQDVTRFLTTILIGTTAANIAATALVTDAATALFGEAGVGAATAVMTVVVLLVTEIAPKSIAVHNATEVARFVVRPVAWLSVVLYPVGRLVNMMSNGLLKLFGLKTSGLPFVTEEELRVMLREAESSGAIEEEEQDMIENVLEIKDTHVREVMTPLVDVVAIDDEATLLEFREFWAKHQYSRVPVFERRIDNIVGIAYAMDMLDYIEKTEVLQTLTVGRIAHRPAYFVPDSMSVWNLLKEFRIRKSHMAIVINEYGGAIGIVTLEDVVEEIVGEIFDENDSKEEIRKKTGFIVQRADGMFDVDANTSIEDLSDALQVKFPEERDYETVSGFVCESFGYIPRTGESMKVILPKRDANEDHKEADGEIAEERRDRHDEKREKREKFQTYHLEVLAGNARKVNAARFKELNTSNGPEEIPRPLPRFVRRAWEHQCDESDDPDNGKVAIIWDGKSIPCASQAGEDEDVLCTVDEERLEVTTSIASEPPTLEASWEEQMKDGEEEQSLRKQRRRKAEEDDHQA